MTLTNRIFESMNLNEDIKKQLHNNWDGTPFEDYPRLDPKQKGGLGEKYVEGLMVALGRTVIDPTNPGHDRIIDLKKTEIKFSLANSMTKTDGKLIDPDLFTFNHIAAEKDWEEFIFLGINPELDNPNIRAYAETWWPTHRLYTMCKEDFVSYLHSGRNAVFKKQQGGKKAHNDDYIVSGRGTFYKLISLPFVKEISLEGIR